ncbi:MAG: sugar phosphate isomerase/epimerase family protein [Phycisphaerae bacterium]
MFTQISYWAFRDGATGKRNVIEAIGLAKAAGFEGIELCVSAEGDITPDTPADKCREISAAAKSMGMKIASTASGLLWDANPASADAATRKRALDITIKSLRVTRDLGAKFLLVLPGAVDVFFKPGGEVVPYDDCHKRALAFARKVAKAAAKLGVFACFENVWNRFLLSPLEFRDFVDAAGKGAGSYFDVGNVWLTGYPQHWIKVLGRRIKAVHVKDFKRAVGNVSGFCQLLDGDVPLAESLALLARQGYKGPVTAEVFPGPDDDEMTFLRTVAERIRKIMP